MCIVKKWHKFWYNYHFNRINKYDNPMASDEKREFHRKMATYHGERKD